MIYALYSTDYELFLGANYAPEKEVLIDPTERLLKSCEEIGVPMNIFADVACVWRYRELGMHEFPEQVEAQLKSAISRGHDVQTHLHPHWLFASLDGKRWSYPPEKFLLGKIAGDEKACEEAAIQYLGKASEYLNALLQPVNSQYRCVAYRAGGFGLQPNDRAVFSALEKTGYVIDSSVVPGMVLNSNVNLIDFSKVPSSSNYYLSGRDGLSVASSQGIFEIPIAAAKLDLLDYAKLQKQNVSAKVRRNPNEWDGRGSSIQELGEQSSGIPNRVARGIGRKLEKLKKRWVALDLRPNAEPLSAVTKAYLRRVMQGDRNGDIYFSLISHSKTLSNEMLKALGQYHEEMTRYYGADFKAITFQQAAENLKKDRYANA